MTEPLDASNLSKFAEVKDAMKVQRHILLRPKGRNQSLADVFRTGIRQLKQTILGHKKTESTKHTIKKLLQAARHEAREEIDPALPADDLKAQVLAKLTNRVKMRSASLCQLQRVGTLNSPLPSAHESSHPAAETRDELDPPSGTARAPFCIPLYPLGTVPDLRAGRVLKVGSSPQHKKLNLNIHHAVLNPDTAHATPRETLKDRRPVPWLQDLKVEVERKPSASPKSYFRRKDSPTKSPTQKKTVSDLDS